jgi:hypothetical protein
MKRHGFVAYALLCLAADEPALACRTPAPIALKDVRHADLVVVGRIAGYRIVRDEELRRKMLSSPTLPAEMREIYESGRSLMGDHGRLEIEVDEVLAGTAPKRIVATWDNSTFSLPDSMAAGPFVIALRRPDSARPPLRGPSATIAPNSEPRSLAILQAPCAPPFLFETGSDRARAVRRLLSRRRR